MTVLPAAPAPGGRTPPDPAHRIGPSTRPGASVSHTPARRVLPPAASRTGVGLVPPNTPGVSPASRGAAHPGRLVAAAYLLSLRAARGLTTRQVSAQVAVTPAGLARIEAWRQEASWPVIAPLMQVYGVTDHEVFAAVRALTDDGGPVRDVRLDHGPGWEQRLAAVEELAEEFTATGVRTFPPVLWSRAFARRQAALGALRPVMRQGLGGDHRGHVEAVVQESALRVAYGGPAVMAEQLAHTLALIAAGRAQVLILPLAAALPLPAVTEIHVRGRVLVAADTGLFGMAYTTEPDVIARYRAQTDAARTASLSPRRSYELLLEAHRVYAGGQPATAIPLLGASAKEAS